MTTIHQDLKPAEPIAGIDTPSAKSIPRWVFWVLATASCLGAVWFLFFDPSNDDKIDFTIPTVNQWYLQKGVDVAPSVFNGTNHDIRIVGLTWC